MNKRNLWVSLAGLMLATLACAMPSLPGSGGPLFKDDFSSDGGGWGVGETDNSAVAIKDGELVINVKRDKFLVWSPADQKDLQNVHIEATAKNVGGGSSTGFGLICNISVTDQFYYFLVTSNGEYAIAKTAVAKDDVYLTNNDQLASSPDIPQNAASYHLGADCGNGTLTLYVNGKKIDSVQDSTYTKGDMGLMALTSKDPTAEIHFDDVVVTALPASK